MNNEKFLKWGAISAIVFVILAGAGYASGGTESRYFVPLFSLTLVFRLIAALAGYELIAKTHYGLARAGLGFAYFAILMMFLEATVWGARSPGGDDTGLIALFESMHLVVLWFVALWVFFWGLAFVQKSGVARGLGALLIFHVFVNLLRYTAIQFEIGGTPAQVIGVIGPVTLLSSYLLLSVVLYRASQTTNE